MDLFDRRPHGQTPGDGAREETVQGTVDRIVFAGSDGAFTVARLAVDDVSEPLTIVGGLLGVPVGARLRVVGRRETTPRFGPQFRVSGFTELAPATLEGIRKYLGSGLMKGIGPELASRIVERFGVQTLEVLDRDPGRISEVSGIGPARARVIRETWTAQREVRKVMVFLQGYGVSPAIAGRIFKRYGVAAVALLRENPYRLAFDVWGIGFLSADKLATALGIAPDAPTRIEAGVRHVLESASTSGDVFVPRERLVRQAAALLNADEGLVQTAIDALGRTGEVVIEARPEAGPLDGGEAVYTVELHRAEVALAAGLAALLAEDADAAGSQAAAKRITRADEGPDPLGDPAQAVAWYESEAQIKLARQQAEAVTRALAARVLVVTGGPGVGKTTIVRGIVSILGRRGCQIALAAPTGRAAKRLSEATGQPATTLHRLLEWRPAQGVFGRAASRPLDAELLVVDEASMLDVRLAADVVAALAPGSRLVLVGDVDQLPSVGPGTVLRDLIDSSVVPTVRLTEIFRQAGQSLIVRNAHRIHDGEMPELVARPAEGHGEELRRDFFFMEEEDPAKAAALIRDLVVSRLPRAYGFGPHDIQVLSPMHRGDLGAGNLNLLLQQALTAGAPGFTRGNRVFHIGDKVMQVRNDYDKDVFNGDIGRVERIDAPGALNGDGTAGATDDTAVIVRFDEREVAYAPDELDELQLAYAATVHKAQGSEYPAVVIPVHTQHFVMLQRNLLYTAVTRARKLVVLVGTRKALGIAVRNGDVALRGSRLDVRLASARQGTTTLPSAIST